jgi:hypothetical protein
MYSAYISGVSLTILRDCFSCLRMWTSVAGYIIVALISLAAGADPPTYHLYISFCCTKCIHGVTCSVAIVSTASTSKAVFSNVSSAFCSDIRPSKLIVFVDASNQCPSPGKVPSLSTLSNSNNRNARSSSICRTRRSGSLRQTERWCHTRVRFPRVNHVRRVKCCRDLTVYPSLFRYFYSLPDRLCISTPVQQHHGESTSIASTASTTSLVTHSRQGQL